MALAASQHRAVLVVCDGVTNATDSDVASLAAARAAREVLVNATDTPAPTPSEREKHWRAQLTLAAEAAQVAAVEAATHIGVTDNPPSCTFVATIVDGPIAASAWIGDSRAYWLTDAGPAVQLSVDDSWATEEIKSGVPREVAEADPRAHAITRWLGFDSPGGDPSFVTTPVTEPGWILVCSDGLWNYCSDAAALRTLLHEKATELDGEPLAISAALVDYANAQGGHDNVTVALARITAHPTTPATIEQAT
jgi:serine/threonine protein phosphatase PrpC